MPSALPEESFGATPPVPPEELIATEPPVPSLYVAPTSTPIVSVTYIEFNSKEIERLDNQVLALREAGEDVSEAADLLQAGKTLKEQGLQREADAVFRQADLLLSSARPAVDAEFGSLRAVAAFLCLLLRARLYLPWQDKIDSFRERLHGPMEQKRVVERKKNRRR